MPAVCIAAAGINEDVLTGSREVRRNGVLTLAGKKETLAQVG